MIYWFSGTGNSKFVAEQLASWLNDRLQSIAVALTDSNSSSIVLPDESIGLVFPVYSWGVPLIILEFISKIATYSFKGQYIYAVATCGDEVAKMPEILQKALSVKGLRASAVFSVIMPNNYVLLPGFDVDKKDVEQHKLSQAPQRIEQVAKEIIRRAECIDVERGGSAWLKSCIVYPLFKKWGIFPNRWKSTDDCIRCGKCEKICPVGNITLEDGRPKWGSNCTSCVACFHYCPVNAIQYGSATRSKSQYKFPIGKDTLK